MRKQTLNERRNKMPISTERVVSEFIARVDGLEFSVKGRITEQMDTETDRKFYWSISHHYRPSENAGVYFPSTVSAKTIEEAEFLLFAYMKNFTCIGVIPNRYF